MGSGIGGGHGKGILTGGSEERRGGGDERANLRA